MRKHDEGYVLAYVMIVVAILTLVAMSVLTVALTNMQQQRTQIEIMQDKYAVQGDIEQTIACLNDVNTVELLGTVFADARADYRVTECEGRTCTLVLEKEGTHVKVTCTLEVTSLQDIESLLGPEASYSFWKPTWKVTAYTVTPVTPTPEGGEGA